jgi:hypothetical protein
MADSYLDMLRWYGERRARNERAEDDRDRLIDAMSDELNAIVQRLADAALRSTADGAEVYATDHLWVPRPE